MASNLQFPQFRKYKGVDTWFKIISEKSFEEVKMIGQQAVYQEVEATKFPEIQFIQDMLACFEGRWVKISEEEYTQISNSV